jgi:flagellar basal body-associated protein FliL
VLNCADYLFVSRKLAQLNANLVESILVLTYKNHLPGEIARKWLKPEELFVLGATTEGEEDMLADVEATGGGTSLANKRRIKGLHRNWKECSLVASLLVTLQMVGTFPFFIQKMMVRFVQPFFYGGMVNVFQMVFANIIYTIIFILMLILLIVWFGFHFILQKKKQKRRVGIASRRSDTHTHGVGGVPIATAEMIPLSPTGHKHHHHHHHHHKKLLEEQQQPLITKQGRSLSLSKDDSKEESGEDNIDDDAKKEAVGGGGGGALDPIPEKHHKHHHHRHSGDKDKDKNERKLRHHHKKEGDGNGVSGEESKGDDLQENTDDEMNPTDKSKKQKKQVSLLLIVCLFVCSFFIAFFHSIVIIIPKTTKFVMLSLVQEEVIVQLKF